MTELGQDSRNGKRRYSGRNGTREGEMRTGSNEEVINIDPTK